MKNRRASGLAGIGLSLGTVIGAIGAPIQVVPNGLAEGDGYGSAVSVWGNVVVVGSPQDDENGANAGAAYLLRRDCSSWVVERKLVPEEVIAGDGFGTAVAVEGDRLVIGAVGSDGGAGAAYVYHFDGNDWGFVQKLPPDPDPSRVKFGTAVSLDGDVIVVGADEDNEHGTKSGAAYVFRFDGKQWAREQKLFAPDALAFDFFGRAVSVRGDTVLVGNPFAFTTNTFAGAVYRFHFDGTTWVEEQKLVADDGLDGDGFGSSVMFDGDTVVIGAPFDNGTRTDSGSAYVFTWNGSTWVQRQKLLPPAGGVFNRFASSVSLSGRALLIGEPGDLDSSATPGAAHLFRFDGVAWSLDRTLTADDGAAQDGFGWSVGLFGDRAVFGAPMNDEAGNASGSAYVDYIGPIGPGDFDGDGDTDLFDFRSFTSCVTGPGPHAAIPAACAGSDFDQDGDVDLRDLAAFQRAFACGN
jgi:hypothetical protein